MVKGFFNLILEMRKLRFRNVRNLTDISQIFVSPDSHPSLLSILYSFFSLMSQNIHSFVHSFIYSERTSYLLEALGQLQGGAYVWFLVLEECSVKEDAVHCSTNSLSFS